MNNQGLTLIEIMVVVAIIAMLAGFALTGYHATRSKVKVENEIKALYGNLENARLRAFTEKRVWGIAWSGSPFSSYELRYDTNSDGSIIDSGGYNSTGTVSDLQFPIKRTGSSNYVTFKTSGLANNLVTLYVDSVSDAEYDCVSVGRTRTKMGHWDGSKCVKR